MGCDYYVETDLYVLFVDETTNRHRLSQQRHWYYALEPEYDSDDPKVVRDAAVAKYHLELEKELRDYSKTMLLYENGKWLTDNQQNITTYTNLIGSNFCNVVKIEKHIYARER